VEIPVGEEHLATGTKHAMDFGQEGGLVSYALQQVVGKGNIDRLIIERQGQLCVVGQQGDALVRNEQTRFAQLVRRPSTRIKRAWRGPRPWRTARSAPRPRPKSTTRVAAERSSSDASHSRCSRSSVCMGV